MYPQHPIMGPGSAIPGSFEHQAQWNAAQAAPIMGAEAVNHALWQAQQAGGADAAHAAAREAMLQSMHAVDTMQPRVIPGAGDRPLTDIGGLPYTGVTDRLGAPAAPPTIDYDVINDKIRRIGAQRFARTVDYTELLSEDAEPPLRARRDMIGDEDIEAIKARFGVGALLRLAIPEFHVNNPSHGTYGEAGSTHRSKDMLPKYDQIVHIKHNDAQSQATYEVPYKEALALGIMGCLSPYAEMQWEGSGEPQRVALHRSFNFAVLYGRYARSAYGTPTVPLSRAGYKTDWPDNPHANSVRKAHLHDIDPRALAKHYIVYDGERTGPEANSLHDILQFMATASCGPLAMIRPAEGGDWKRIIDNPAYVMEIWVRMNNYVRPDRPPADQSRAAATAAAAPQWRNPRAHGPPPFDVSGMATVIARPRYADPYAPRPDDPPQYTQTVPPFPPNNRPRASSPPTRGRTPTTLRDRAAAMARRFRR